MILIAIVGLAFVIGMPYLLDSSTYPHPQTPTKPYWVFPTLPHNTNFIITQASKCGYPTNVSPVDPEMKAEFEEHQKKSILAGGGKTNPLQDFDMAAWMAGKTSVSSARPQAEDEGGAAPRARRRG